MLETLTALAGGGPAPCKASGWGSEDSPVLFGLVQLAMGHNLWLHFGPDEHAVVPFLTPFLVGRE